jgi:hypothetical protein
MYMYITSSSSIVKLRNVQIDRAGLYLVVTVCCTVNQSHSRKMYHVGNQPQSHDDLDIIAAWEKTGYHFPRKSPMKHHE